MKYLFTLVSVFLIHTFCFAQKFSSSSDAQLSIPQSDYKDVNPDAGYGLRLNLLYQPGYLTPVKLGIELGVQEKGRVNQYFSGNAGGFYNDFKVSATSNIFSMMFLIRFQSSQPHKLKPFLDVTAGWNVFFSTASVEELTYYSNYDPSFSNSTKAHWAFAFGAAGGLDIPLNRRDAIGMELKVAYLIGSYTNYLTDPYIDGNGNVSFQANSSRTNMLIPQAGIRITIE